MNKNSLYLFALALYLFTIPMDLWAREDKDFILRLEGNWKFCIGDNAEWANPNFDDNEWETIKVPSAWEDQGFYGYDGYAWYRTSFNYSKDFKNKELYLHLGYIDDVDQVYINGHVIGSSGSFPPQFSIALEAKRKYLIPEEYLNTSGKNIISVRVYNHQMAGGILSGEIGIASAVKPDYSLSGEWLFRTGDNKSWKESEYKDKQWKKIPVPSNWESQGYKDHNGFAWYRKHFLLPADFPTQKVTLVIGNIFNCEEVYLNGTLIGSTGKMPGSKNKEAETDETKKKCRTYTIPENLLHTNKQNLISIRVFNVEHRGGIVEGPVGLFKSATFAKYSKELIEE